MKKINKLFVLSISIILILSLGIPVSAETEPSLKEEVIYIMTDASGTVSQIEAVNSFSGGTILDYGDYSTLKILNTTDTITQDADQITIISEADQVYYQGTMNTNLIPWNISIRYYLDGIEYTPSDLAGMNGALEIQFQISQNEKCEGNFYEDYALQATFTLDTASCSNISASEATIANVGTKKQLTYTILPGKGINTSLYADVTEFELEAITINAIKLNLSVEIDDSELMEKVTELMAATDAIHDGADELSSGTVTLTDGGSSLYDGSTSLYQGVSELDQGVTELQNGIAVMQSGLNTLNQQSATLNSGSSQLKAALNTLQASVNSVSISATQVSQLTSTSSTIKNGIDNLYQAVVTLKDNLNYTAYKAAMNENGLNIDTLITNNTAAINDLSNQITVIQGNLALLPDTSENAAQIAALNSQISQLQSTAQLLGANQAAISGTESYLNQFSIQLTDLTQSVNDLKNNYASFDTAINELAVTLSTMVPKLSELSTGVNTLVQKYSELDSGINNYTQGVASVVAGFQQIVDGTASLAAGSKELLDGSSSLTSGTLEFYQGLLSFSDGVQELTDGAEELNHATSDMDTEIQNKIDEVIDSIDKTGTETYSFVSEKNTNIASLQFVIKTDAIEMKETPVIETDAPAKLNFWQKLLHLFGL